MVAHRCLCSSSHMFHLPNENFACILMPRFTCLLAESFLTIYLLVTTYNLLMESHTTLQADITRSHDSRIYEPSTRSGTSFPPHYCDYRITSTVLRPQYYCTCSRPRLAEDLAAARDDSEDQRSAAQLQLIVQCLHRPSPVTLFCLPGCSSLRENGPLRRWRTVLFCRYVCLIRTSKTIDLSSLKPCLGSSQRIIFP